MSMRVATVIALAVGAIVTGRAVRHPVDTYGDSGAGYIEHLERVRVLERLIGSGGSWLDRLRAADGLYPPGLHILSAPASFLGDHQPASVAVLGALWLLILATAVATCARSIHTDAGTPAFVATLLTPALHAVAPRYYYDLPMTALIWSAAAVLVHVRARPIGGGFYAACVFALACFVKWSALPLGLPVVAMGLLLCARQDRPLALHTALSFAVCSGLLVLPVMLASNSFGAMGGATFQPPPSIPLPEWSSTIDTLRPGLGHALGSMALQARVDGPARAWFYLERLGTTLLAPALLPSVAIVVGTWMRRGSPGGLAFLTAVGGVLAFVLLAVPPLDERFVLTILPVVPTIAGIGFALLPRGTTLLGVVSMALGLAVAVDFHTGQPTDAADAPVHTGHHLEPRWGLSTSVDRRGWARLDDLPDHNRALRTDLLTMVQRCDAQQVIGDDVLVAARGDLNWWTFEFEREALIRHRTPRRFQTTEPTETREPVAPPLVFTRSGLPPTIGLEPYGVVHRVYVWAAEGACITRP